MLFDVVAAELERAVAISVAFLEVYNDTVRDLLVAGKDAAPLEVSGLAAGQLGPGGRLPQPHRSTCLFATVPRWCAHM